MLVTRCNVQDAMAEQGDSRGSIVSEQRREPTRSEALYQQVIQAKCLDLTRKDGREISEDASMDTSTQTKSGEVQCRCIQDAVLNIKWGVRSRKWNSGNLGG